MMVQQQQEVVLARAIAEQIPHSYVSVIERDLTVGFTAGSAFGERGLDPDDFVGLTLDQVFGPYGDDVVRTVTAAYRRAFLGRTQMFELTIGGEHQRYVAVPLTGLSGAVERIVAIVQDVSVERREAAERVDLERRVLQLQRLDAIGKLVSGVAHDFNNMLSVIIGYADLALTTLTPDHPLHADLREIEGAARRSAGLTRQLLGFARQQPRAPEVLDLRSHLNAMEQLLRRTLGEHIELRFDYASDLWPVHMDPSQIDQVVANLAVNARDAMPEGGQLTIELRNRTFDAEYAASHPGFTAGAYVQMAVTDTGVGIPPDIQERVFEPFFTTKEPDGGSGLGLATVYGIVGQNQGNVHLYSEPGLGTTISVYVPRHHGAVTDAGMASTRELPGGSETILLVEDEARLRVLTQRLLERLGYTVLAAETGVQALDMVSGLEGGLDLLLTDMVLPGMHGTELAATLRSRIPGVRLVFLSGYAPQAARGRTVPTRGAHFLQKPVELDVLARTLRAALAGAEGA